MVRPQIVLVFDTVFTSSNRMRKILDDIVFWFNVPFRASNNLQSYYKSQRTEIFSKRRKICAICADPYECSTNIKQALCRSQQNYTIIGTHNGLYSSTVWWESGPFGCWEVIVMFEQLYPPLAGVFSRDFFY